MAWVVCLVALLFMYQTFSVFEQSPYQDGYRCSFFPHSYSEGQTVLIVPSVYQNRLATLCFGWDLRALDLNPVVLELPPGRSFEEYVEKVKDLCRESEGIHLIGHSMGADIVATAALGEPNVKSVVALGSPIETEGLTCPYLLAFGTWDQVYSRRDLESRYPAENLYFSPTSAHSQEMADNRIRHRIGEFYGQVPLSELELGLMLSRGFFVLSVASLTVLLLPRRLWPRLAACLYGGLVFLGFCVPKDLLLTLLTLGLGLGLIVRNSAPWQPWSRLESLFRQILALSVCVALSLLIGCWQSLLSQPSALWGLPLVVTSWWAMLAACLGHFAYSFYLSGWSALLVLVAVLELAFPGGLGRGILFSHASTVETSEFLRAQAGHRS